MSIQDDGFRYTRGFVFIMMAVTCASTLVVRKLYDKFHQAERQAAAIVSTNMAQFKPLADGSAQAAGHTPTQAEIDSIVAQKLGAEVAKEIKRLRGSTTAVLTATSTTEASTSLPVSVPMEPTFTGHVATIAQDRGGLPPLTKVDIAVSPTFETSTYWTNYSEKFTESFAIVRDKKDGIRGFSKLTREVNGVTEEIKTTGSDFNVPISEVTRIAPFPKGDYGLGTWFDTHSGHVRPLITTSRQWTRSLSTGAVIVPGSGYGVVVRKTFGSQ